MKLPDALASRLPLHMTMSPVWVDVNRYGQILLEDVLHRRCYLMIEAERDRILNVQKIMRDAIINLLIESIRADSCYHATTRMVIYNTNDFYREVLQRTQLTTMLDRVVQLIRDGDPYNELPFIRGCLKQQDHAVIERVRCMLFNMEGIADLKGMTASFMEIQPSTVLENKYRLIHYLVYKRYPPQKSHGIDPYEAVPYLQTMLRIAGYHTKIIHLKGFRHQPEFGYTKEDISKQHCVLKVGNSVVDVARNTIDEFSPHPTIASVQELTQQWFWVSDLSKDHCVCLMMRGDV